MSFCPVELARLLLRVPSVTPAPLKAFTPLEAVLKPVGFQWRVLSLSEKNSPSVYNVLAFFGQGKPHFCFSGHLDVVPPGDEKWRYPPFSGEVKEGVLWGRGAVDMKGAVAAFGVAAGKFCATEDFQGTVSMLLTADEEGEATCGTVKALQWMLNHSSSSLPPPSLVLVGEPTNPAQFGEMIKIGRRGSFSGELSFFAPSKHVAYGTVRDNPIFPLLCVLKTLSLTPIEAGSDYFEPSSFQVTSLDARSVAPNVTPEKATCAFNIRFSPLMNEEKIIKAIETVCVTACENYTLRGRVNCEPFLSPLSWEAKMLASIVKKVTKISPVFDTKGGTSDGRFFAPLCPVIEFGLVGQTMHQVNERVAVDHLHSLATIYERFLRAYFSATSSSL